MFSFQLTFNSNNAYKISFKENKNKQLELNDMNGRCLFLVTLINYKSNLVLLNSKKKKKKFYKFAW